MNATARLLEVASALTASGLKFLIMGGHAVRHYGIDRNTFDFDFHVSLDSAGDLETRLRTTVLFPSGELSEGVSWRREDFRRFQVGTLPNGREEWLEFWLRNHLLAPFHEMYERREEAVERGVVLCFLSLPDLIRSKETERDDDWNDVRLLEEVQDGRNLANVSTPSQTVHALSRIRSRRGFESAEARGCFRDPVTVREACRQAAHPVTRAYLLPFVPDVGSLGLERTVEEALRRQRPGSARHLAVAEAVRLTYQRAARAEDRADKERFRSRQEP